MFSDVHHSSFCCGDVTALNVWSTICSGDIKVHGRDYQSIKHSCYFARLCCTSALIRIR